LGARPENSRERIEASADHLSRHNGVAVRDDGTIAVAEAANHTVRLVCPVEADRSDGAAKYTVSTRAGVTCAKGFKDGLAGEALFNAPHAVSWGVNGELYVADIGNARLRRIKDGVVICIAALR